MPKRSVPFFFFLPSFLRFANCSVSGIVFRYAEVVAFAQYRDGGDDDDLYHYLLGEEGPTGIHQTSLSQQGVTAATIDYVILAISYSDYLFLH